MLEIGIPIYSNNDEDGYVGVQVDQHGDGSSDPTCPAGEVHTPYGFYCRPLDPVVSPPDAEGQRSLDPTQSGKAIFFWLNQDLHVIPSQDTRIVPKLPPLDKGESLVYGQDGQFIRCRNGGEIALMTTDDATVDGQSIYMTIKPTGFVRTSPWGTERFDNSGFHVTTTTGASLDIGGIGGIPGFSQFGSYATLRAAIAQINAAAVSLGSSAMQDNVATSIATITSLNVIPAQFALLMAAILATGPTPLTGASLAGLMAPFLTPGTGTLPIALTAAELLIPSPQVTATVGV